MHVSIYLQLGERIVIPANKGLDNYEGRSENPSKRASRGLGKRESSAIRGNI